MTAQIPDSLLLENRKLSLVGVNGGELFNPSRFGLSPFPSFTACWRGFVCQYKVRDARLMLDQLQVSLAAPAEPGQRSAFVGQAGPAINGISPVFPNEAFPPLNNRYEALNLEVQFSGGLLAGAGFLRELYVHMGFHPAWKYETVYELITFDGQVSEVRDVSQGMAAIRDAMGKRAIQPDLDVDEQDLRSWIESTFKLNYNL
jgi:hypothetical protein